MGIYEGEMIGADGEIALTVNDIEKLTITEPDEEKLNSLIARLKVLSRQFPESVRKYIDEIRGVVGFTVKYYKEQEARTPDISFLNDYEK